MPNAHHAYLTREHFAVNRSNIIIVIYLLECDLCKIQYVGESESPFNVHLYNHRKDVKDQSAIPADKCLP